MSTTRVTRHIRAPRARVYRALLDPDSVQRWMVPDQMTSHIDSFEAREGGTFRISLTYDMPTTAGKADPQTDAGDGTDLVGLHENLPPGVSPSDNELGWSMSIDKLADLVEHDS